MKLPHKQKQGRELLKCIRKQIQQKKYATVSFSLSKKELTSVAEHFLEFLRLPTELKEQFYFLIDPKHRGSNVGYVRKQKEYGGDDKELFHYNEWAEDAFKELLTSGTPPVTNFFDSARNVYKAAKATIKRVIQAFEIEFPGMYKKFFPDKGYPHLYLRFLKYNVIERGTVLARGHYDISGCTLTITESGPGLRMGTDNSDLKPVECKEGDVLFTTGLNFKKITSAEFPLTWHDVIKTGRNYSKDVARWSIVFFADPIGMEAPTLAQTHTLKKP
ncbi:hypothetical protein MYX06_03045 [Patescibacteria group bacterium AH-259-L05]|nr:hypothetical protein [Patescibacteria group bacterium AH-259-L05]